MQNYALWITKTYAHNISAMFSFSRVFTYYILFCAIFIIHGSGALNNSLEKSYKDFFAWASLDQRSTVIYYFEGLLLESNTRIRDVYVFKRGYQCPVLKIEEFGEDYVTTKRQQQVNPSFSFFSFLNLNWCYLFERFLMMIFCWC